LLTAKTQKTQRKDKIKKEPQINTDKKGKKNLFLMGAHAE